MICFLIILFIVNIILTIVINKKGFLTQNIRYYILYTLIFIFILTFNFTLAFKIKIICLYMSNKILYESVIVTFSLFTMVVCENHHSYKTISKIIFKRTLNLASKKPTILISNYPSDYLEYFIPGLFEQNVCIVVFKGAKKRLDNIFREKIIYIDLNTKNNFETLKKDIQDRVKKGYSIYVYPEKIYYERKNIYTLQKFKSGIFHIAKMLNLTITPVICDHSENNFGFNNYSSEKYKIKILPSFEIKNVEQDMEKCFNIMRRSLKHLSYKN
jgi:1-acyl-sn-glycerol-3-phosphate acyltransferase